MAKIWSTTVPNIQLSPTSNRNDLSAPTVSSITTTSNADFKPKNSPITTVRNDINNYNNINNSNIITNNNNNIDSSKLVLNEKQRMALEMSNTEYNEFWRKLKAMNTNDTRVIKTVPDVTFSWEGVNAVCQKKRNVFTQCWEKVRSNKSASKIAEGGRDREAIIGKWEPSRGGNDSYLQLNENKVTAISYRTSNNSSSSSSSSTSSSTAEDQSIESFSSSSSFGSKPNGFQVLNNGKIFERINQTKN